MLKVANSRNSERTGSVGELPVWLPCVTFQTTDWVAIQEASGEQEVVSGQALERICTVYWFPLYAYARRRGYSTHDAQDLTQAFFSRLVEKQTCRIANPGRGRFRTFLLTAFSRFLKDCHAHATAGKRGGGCPPVSIDARDAEGLYEAEGVDHFTPECVYERQWATTLLDRVVRRLASEFSAQGRMEFFESLKPYLWGEQSLAPQREVALRFGMSEGAIKVTLCRLRSRYRNLLRQEIALTVSSPSEVDDEIRHLMSMWNG